MNLYNFYLLSQGIYGVVATLFFIVLTIVVIILMVKVNRLSRQVDEIAKNGIETSNTLKEFIKNTVDQLNMFSRNFLTWEAVRRLFRSIINKNK